MKRLGLFILYCVVFARPLIAREATAPLQELERLLLNRNPEINATYHRWKTLENEAKAEGWWPNPTVTYAEEKEPSGMEGVEPEKMKSLGVSQEIPFPGKVSAEGRMKRHEALIAESDHRDKILELIMKLRQSYYQLYLTDELISLVQQSLQTLRSALKTAQSRVASGRVSATDVFMTQTELGRMENMLFEQKQGRVIIESELNALLDYGPDQTWGRAVALPLKDLSPSLEELFALAENNHPVIQKTRHEHSHSRAMLVRNRLEWMPDFEVMGRRIEAEQGPAGNEIGVSASLPVWFRRPWGRSQAGKQHVLQAEAEISGMRNMINKMIRMEFTQVNTRLTLARNYSSAILPSALANLNLAREQYLSGRGDFLRFLEAYRTWIETNNEYQNEVYHHGEHWSELERWVGVPLKAKDR